MPTSKPFSARAFADSCPIPESEPVTIATGLMPAPYGVLSPDGSCSCLLEARGPCQPYPRWGGANTSVTAAGAPESCVSGIVELVLDHPAALHDQPEVLRLLEDGDVLKRIAGHHEQIRELALLNGAYLVLHAEELGVGLGCRDEALHRAHDLRLDLQLARLAALQGSQEIRAGGDPDARLVGVAQGADAHLPRLVYLADDVLGHTVAPPLLGESLVGGEGWHEVRAGLGYEARRLLVYKVAVLDGAYPRLEAVPHAAVVVSVCHHVGAGALGHLDGSPELIQGVLGGGELVGRGHRAATGHHLDLVCPQPELLPGGAPYLVHPVADDRAHPRGGAEDLGRLFLAHAPPVAVPPGLRERPVADQQPRTLHYTPLHRRLEAPVRPAGVPHGGEPPLKGILENPRHHQGDEVGGVFPVLVEDVDVDGPDVDVGVGQPGQERHPRAVDDRVMRARRAGTSETNLSYPLAFEDYRGLLMRLAPGAVYEESIHEKRGVGHLVPPSRGGPSSPGT